jgi:hypothetical protein
MTPNRQKILWVDDAGDWGASRDNGTRDGEHGDWHCEAKECVNVDDGDDGGGGEDDDDDDDLPYWKSPDGDWVGDEDNNMDDDIWTTI